MPRLRIRHKILIVIFAAVCYNSRMGLFGENMTPAQARAIGPVALAFVGDAAESLFVRDVYKRQVECGVEVQLPAEEDAGAYADVLAVLAQVTGSLADGAYPARALRTCNEGTAYGAGEVVFVPAGTGHGAALVRSLAENNAQPPYSAEGALSSAWEEVFSFSSLLEEFGQQLGAFAATNVPVSYTHLDVYKRQR